jgi:hypothetical protein
MLALARTEVGVESVGMKLSKQCMVKFMAAHLEVPLGAIERIGRLIVESSQGSNSGKTISGF